MPRQYSQEYLSESKQSEILGVGIILPILSISAVLLRFVSRIHGKNGFWWDDWLILLALLCSVGVNIVTLLTLNYGFGRHIQTSSTPVKTTMQYFHTFYPDEIMYNTTLCIVKFSVLCFYARIFPVKKMIISCYAIGTLITTYFVATTAVLIFECFPARKFWEPQVKGTCINLPAWFLGQAIPNIVTDVALLVIPIPFIWQLNMRGSQKFAIVGIFLTGGFVTIVSIVRLVRLAQLKYDDVTWNWVGVELWSDVEPSMAVVSACLPSLAPLFKSTMSRITGQASGRRHFSWFDAGPGMRKFKKTISLPLESRQNAVAFAQRPPPSPTSLYSEEKPIDMAYSLRPQHEWTTAHADMGSPKLDMHDGSGWYDDVEHSSRPLDSIGLKREISVFQEQDPTQYV